MKIGTIKKKKSTGLLCFNNKVVGTVFDRIFFSNYLLSNAHSGANPWWVFVAWFQCAYTIAEV